MPQEFKPGCQRPVSKQARELSQTTTESKKEEKKTMINVGQAAPDFTLPALIDGKFANVSLSEFKDKWVVLCFYPGDFTFV